MSKEYEKIRSQVAKQYKDEINKLRNERNDLRMSLELANSELYLVQKENEKLKVENTKLQFLCGKAKEEIENFELSEKIRKQYMDLLSLFGVDKQLRH